MSESFAQRLTRLRQHIHREPGEFARDIAITPAMISYLESGQRQGGNLRADILYRMALRLGVTMEYLLTGTTRRTRHTACARDRGRREDACGGTTRSTRHE